ncbi:MAG: DUF6600 domain-containing protein [Gammaproteobacteria bacterium]
MMLRPALLLLALAASPLAWGGSEDPSARIARLSYVEGEITFRAEGERATTALPDRPLASGDSLATRYNARAELALGTATLRLDEQSEFVMADLDVEAVRVELEAGTLSVYLRELLEDESFEIRTPNAAITLDEPGEYRADVRSDEVTAFTVHKGGATAATAGGPVRIAAGQRVRLEGRDSVARLETLRPADDFDEWVMERELRFAETGAPRYTPYEGDGYDELDRYGEWRDDSRYGRVWMPGYGYSGWSPYRDGYWARSGYGWGWYDPAPWGFFTYYSGRWTYLNHLNRWCWVPGRHDRGRNFAHGDTRPWGWRRDDSRERVERPDAPPTSNRQLGDRGERQPVMTAGSGTRRTDGERRPARERESAPPARQRETASPSPQRDTAPSSPPRDSSGVSQPRGSGTTMRPSRNENTRLRR